MDLLAPFSSYKANKAFEEIKQHFIRDEYDEAEKKAKALLEQSPNHTKTILLLAQIAYNRHHFQQARERYNKVLEYTSDTEARFGRAQCSFDLHHYEEALDDYLYLYETSFKTTTYLLKLGETFHRLGLQKIALRYYEKAVKQSPNSIEAHLHMAEHLLTLGRYEDARTHTATAKNIYYQHKHELAPEVLTNISDLDSTIEHHMSKGKKHTKK